MTKKSFATFLSIIFICVCALVAIVISSWDDIEAAVVVNREKDVQYMNEHTYDATAIKEYVVTEQQTNNFGGVIRTEHKVMYTFVANGKIHTDFDPSYYNKTVKFGKKSQWIKCRDDSEILIISEEDLEER